MYTVVKAFTSMQNVPYKIGQLVDEATYDNMPPNDRRYLSIVTPELQANQDAIVAATPNTVAIAASNDTQNY